ncbi:hypothetical protein [Pseudalkalibacillus decolorationis]|nr:hypothetical protein [Pseudalkalibacillus decolorationis]
MNNTLHDKRIGEFYLDSGNTNAQKVWKKKATKKQTAKSKQPDLN